MAAANYRIIECMYQHRSRKSMYARIRMGVIERWKQILRRTSELYWKCYTTVGTLTIYLLPKSALSINYYFRFSGCSCDSSIIFMFSADILKWNDHLLSFPFSLWVCEVETVSNLERRYSDPKYDLVEFLRLLPSSFILGSIAFDALRNRFFLLICS